MLEVSEYTQKSKEDPLSFLKGISMKICYVLKPGEFIPTGRCHLQLWAFVRM